MKKTEELFAKYAKLINEEKLDLESPETPDATDIAEMPEDALEPQEDEMTSEGEKYLVELLVKAFLHEPDESGAATAKELQAQIDEDPKGVASAISNMVELGEGEMKDTLAQV